MMNDLDILGQLIAMFGNLLVTALCGQLSWARRHQIS